jgi:predicted nucleic acid-binding protein
MKVVFADSYFYLALLNPRDAGHEAASRAASEFVGKIVTSQWVLVEVGDAFSDPSHRPLFERLMATLSLNADVDIVAADDSWFRQGLELYQRRSDKKWSLTDCISFCIMESRSIRDALTGDRHFQQAGFSALLPTQ